VSDLAALLSATIAINAINIRRMSRAVEIVIVASSRAQSVRSIESARHLWPF
jgi:hypothetical protein